MFSTLRLSLVLNVLLLSFGAGFVLTGTVGATDPLFFVKARPRHDAETLNLTAAELLSYEPPGSSILSIDPPSRGTLVNEFDGWTYSADPRFRDHGVDSFKVHIATPGGNVSRTVFLIRDLTDDGIEYFGATTAGGNVVILIDLDLDERPALGSVTDHRLAQAWSNVGEPIYSIFGQRLNPTTVRVWIEAARADGSTVASSTMDLVPDPDQPLETLSVDWQPASTPRTRNGSVVLRWGHSYVALSGLNKHFNRLSEWEVGVGGESQSGHVVAFAPSSRRMVFPPSFRDGFSTGTAANRAGWSRSHVGPTTGATIESEAAPSNDHWLALPLGRKEAYWADASLTGSTRHQMRMVLRSGPGCSISPAGGAGPTGGTGGTLPLAAAFDSNGRQLWAIDAIVRSQSVELVLSADNTSGSSFGGVALSDSVTVAPGEIVLTLDWWSGDGVEAGGARLWLDGIALIAPDLELDLPNVQGVLDEIRIGQPRPSTGLTGTLCLDDYTSVY